MVNQITKGVEELHAYAKLFQNIGQNVDIVCKDTTMEFYCLSMSQSSMIVVQMEQEQNLDQLNATIAAEHLAGLTKGMKQGDILGYSNSVLQRVSKQKSITVNLSEMYAENRNKPTIPFTNTFTVDGKALIAALKEAKGMFSGARRVLLKHIGKELILDVSDGTNAANQYVVQLPCDPIKGEACEAYYRIEQLLEVLVPEEVAISIGNDLPLKVAKMSEGVYFEAIVAPLIVEVGQ